MEFYNKKYSTNRQCNIFPILQKSGKAISSLIIIFLALYSQTAYGAIPEIPTSIKISIDPGRVKERIKPKKKPRDLVIPKKITKKPSEKKDRVTTKSQEKMDSIKFKLATVVIKGATAYKKNELSKYYEPHLNKDVTFSDLQNIASEITKRYRKDGYVISRAILPPQTIDSGKVIIQIIEGYISEIYIEGKAKKARSQIKKYGEKIKQMKPLQNKDLERYTLLINDIPGLTTKTILSPSLSTIGGADLTFIIEQERVDGEIYIDNRGSRYLGPVQTAANASIRDVFSAADDLSIQTIFTPYHSELRYIQTTYNHPLGISGLRVSIDGAFTETRPGFTLKEFSVVGRSKNFGVNIEYPLIRSRTKNLWLYGKFDWLDTYTKILTYTLFADHTRSVRAGISFDFIDNWKGGNIVSLEFSKGLKIFGASPLEPSTPLSRLQGLSNYKKINLDLSRYQSISQNWMLLSAISSQYSFHNQLLSSEEFSFGGQQFGRAYDPSEIAGDSGINGKLELRFNTFPDLRFLQQIQYYTFYEIGAVWNVGQDFSQLDKDSASNLGAGLRTTFNGYFYGNLEITKPLTRDVNTLTSSGKNGKGWRFYLGLGVNL